MRFLTAVASLLLFGVSLIRAQAPSAPPAAAKDTVMVVGMSPASFVDGVETEVEVKVAFELDAQPEGVIEIGANTLTARGFSSFASQRVVRGSDIVTLRGKFTPRFWTANIVPRLSAMLVVPGEELTQRKVMASDNKAITVTLRPNPSETYAVNPNPSVVREDGLRIKSITPDRFVEGQPVIVEVVVSYELVSREAGEINLGFSQGRANAYSSSVKQQVSAGQGEIVIRGRVVPKRTGNLPFMKIHVNMAEFPRRPRFTPLASDAETVEVSPGGS
jgi:hypothetical protein